MSASGATACTDWRCPEHSPLMKAPVRFWCCPVPEHRDRRGVVTVEWRGDIACCTEPTCSNTSASSESGEVGR